MHLLTLCSILVEIVTSWGENECGSFLKNMDKEGRHACVQSNLEFIFSNSTFVGHFRFHSLLDVISSSIFKPFKKSFYFTKTKASFF